MHGGASSELRKADVAWRDLMSLRRAELAWEISLSAPWLAGSLVAYHYGWFPVGAGCSFYFFLTGLRQSHGAQHYTLGFSKRIQDGVLFVLSLCMLASMHAVQTSHLHHHRRCLQDDDAEGSAARMPWWRAILAGPAFLWGLHANGWRLAKGPKRRWIAAELVGAGAVIAVAAARPVAALQWHVLAMLAGECLTGFFAVWTVHHGCDPHETVARTQRGRWVNRLCYGMFYHAEHHLFPQVPTCHLGVLAERLDRASAEFAALQVIPSSGRAAASGAAPARVAS
ncbi:MAG TPA: fatty acid desaturase [Planctomycetia bacterium]|nr:fatty acid desaturase [Planctomycetia bacterium]